MQKMHCMGKNHTHFGQEPHFSRLDGAGPGGAHRGPVWLLATAALRPVAPLPHAPRRALLLPFALMQTVQALVAAAAAADSPRPSLRVTHRVLPHGNGVAAIADSIMSILRGTPARMLVSSRYAVPVDAVSGGPVFRVFPVRQASLLLET